jgi:predicted MPP superfamily phosphohydrolase
MAYWIALVITYILLENIGFAALQVWLLGRQGPRSRRLSRAIWIWCGLMCSLFLIEAFEPDGWRYFVRDWLYFPMAVEMVWNILLLQVLLPATLFIVIVLRLLRRFRKPRPADSEGISRRRFLYLLSYGAAPAVAIGMGVHGTLTREDLRVRKFSIPIPNLPPELEGFTIAHISDLHSGIFVGPDRLKRMTDAANDHKADLVAITGDIINRSMGEFPDALAAIQRIESNHGIYLCEGNHDVIPGELVVFDACEQNRLPMIYNTCRPIPIRGQRLLLGGLSWNSVFVYKQRTDLVTRLFPERLPGDVRILLAHHPHLFDIAENADLVLSGHTHGGQIMLTEEIGLGRIRFKYCSGLFHRDNTTMIVSNGCGDWFPCRIGAPAEIGLLTLTAAKPA